MPWLRWSGPIVVSIIVFLSKASSNPDVQFPVNSQVPPVALTSQPYTFTFAESTFISAVGPITYALCDGPVWLQLDSETRTFSGRPQSDDIGSVKFQLIASDAQGPTSMNVTLIVVRDGDLEVGQSILSQLAGFIMPSSSSSLLFYPLQSFAFNFLPDSFVGTSWSTTYYALSTDNSPLPSWLEFDASNLGFSGTTPPLVSPAATPQTYGLKLVASNVPGFSEASAIFQIVVGYHVLSFSAANEDVNATPGQKVVTPPLLYTLSLDGERAQDSDLASVTADAPSWLVLDHENISLSGIPPADTENFSVTVSAMDVHGDIANASVNFFMSSLRHLFLEDALLANATIGHDFNYSISRSSLVSGNVTVVADLGSASAWLTFNPSDLSFDGRVPPDLSPAPVNITLYATLGYDTDMGILQIDLIRGSATTSVAHTVATWASAKSTSSSASEPSDPPNATGRSPLSRYARLIIVLAVVLPALVVILFITVLVSCLQRKQKLPPEPGTGVASPVHAPPVREHVETEPLHVRSAESSHSGEMQRHTAPDEPPRVELSWTPDSLRMANARFSKQIYMSDGSLPSLRFSGSLSHDLGSPLDKPTTENDPPSQITRRSGDLASFMNTRRSHYSRGRAPLGPIQSKVEEVAAPKRASKALSAISTTTFGLPSRLSGAGHGVGRAGPPGFQDVRSSWQDTESTLPSIDSRATALNLVEAFPRPPIKTEGRRSIKYPQSSGKASLRMVATSSSQTGTSTEQRHRWFTERARDPCEPGACNSHSRSSRPYSVCRSLETEKSTVGHDGQLSSLNSTYALRSENVAAGVLTQPHITTRGRSPRRPSVRPPSNLMQDGSIASSGQFDSALSTSSSQWEDDILAMKVDFRGDNQYLTESARRNSHGISPRNAQASRSGMIATRLSDVSSLEDPDTSPASRKLRLGDVPGQRPVSVGEGSLQKLQRSHQGSLAFM